MLRYLSVRNSLLLLVGVSAAACGSSSLDIGGPLTLSISAVSPVVVTDSLILQFDVAGTALLGVVIDFGDMQIDSVPFLESQTAGGRRPHLYAAPGQYLITVRAEDRTQPSVTEQLTVTINPVVNP